MLTNPKNYHPGERNTEMELRRIKQQVADLVQRVTQLEAKRGPGRPPKPKEDEAA